MNITMLSPSNALGISASGQQSQAHTLDLWFTDQILQISDDQSYLEAEKSTGSVTSKMSTATFHLLSPE